MKNYWTTRREIIRERVRYQLGWPDVMVELDNNQIDWCVDYSREQLKDKLVLDDWTDVVVHTASLLAEQLLWHVRLKFPTDNTRQKYKEAKEKCQTWFEVIHSAPNDKPLSTR